MIKTRSGTILQNPSLIKWLIYLINTLSNLLINFDHGIIPAATMEIKEYLNIDDVKLGFLGSIVYIGLTIGSIASSYSFQKIITKRLICISIIFLVFSLYLFLLTKNFILLCLSRFLVGFFQVFLVVYFPVWVDVNIREKQNNIYKFKQTQKKKWDNAFLLQIFSLLTCCLLLFFFKEQDLDIQCVTIQKQNISLQEEKLIQEEDDNQSKFEFQQNKKENTYFQNLMLLWENKVYVYTMLTLTALYFVVTGIQFWMSDYMRIVLKIDQALVYTSFSIISLTAPAFGVIIGGIALHQAGGYNGKYVLSICMLNGVCASMCAIPIPFQKDFSIVVTLLWFLMFFEAAMIPAIMGLMLSSVQKKLRAFCNSTAQLFYNLLGYLPAPFLYGLINKISRSEASINGMIFLMAWSFWGVIGLYFAKIYRDQEIQEEEIIIGQYEYQMTEKNLQLMHIKNKIKQQFNYKNTCILFFIIHIIYNIQSVQNNGKRI
ncbi:major facilitator superfamily protein, putative [Ichthyophthirius multifiliis]|uniref:Major facilitator superfamily protein, putative n=1 Tax=Ichthyophthirius multifiliis TaxID=5932 RepID=G0QXY9_ICHMU|nr:major facilitator superfamily protein, putative [Ichthyophthirius multifiliis]EGR29914.1 major facilitator superfamily protein, putative [Ichthyophthirius multifiliis]|eukprot:XP_004031150.1 major facilitator superfamily protein, putative [Ichthyophthirius multifiliis]